MIGRRAATNAGRTLNSIAQEHADEAEITSAVRIANVVMYQYYLIPRSIREEFFREELLPDGVPLCTEPEE